MATRTEKLLAFLVRAESARQPFHEALEGETAKLAKEILAEPTDATTLVDMVREQNREDEVAQGSRVRRGAAKEDEPAGLDGQGGDQEGA